MLSSNDALHAPALTQPCSTATKNVREVTGSSTNPFVALREKEVAS